MRRIGGQFLESYTAFRLDERIDGHIAHLAMRPEGEALLKKRPQHGRRLFLCGAGRNPGLNVPSNAVEPAIAEDVDDCYSVRSAKDGPHGQAADVDAISRDAHVGRQIAAVAISSGVGVWSGVSLTLAAAKARGSDCCAAAQAAQAAKAASRAVSEQYLRICAG